MDTFINPYTDFGFKKLFGEEQSKHLLISFLNDLLGEREQITDLTFKNTEHLPVVNSQRKAVFDIFCTNDKGEHFIVEMQKAKQDYFKDRSVFYSTFPIQEQAEKGSEWNFELKAVYCIGILDFRFNDHKDCTEVIHTVQLKNQHNQLFYDKLKFIYVEMPNFNKTLEQLETHQDRWFYFIKNLANLQHIPELFRDDIIYQGFETARIASLNDIEKDVYQDSLKVYRDMFSVIQTSKIEGFDEGFNGGFNKSTVAGITGLLHQKILTDKQIATALKVTVEQVAALRLTLGDNK